MTANLLVMPQPGEHLSASRRKILNLEAANDQMRGMIAVLVAQMGGRAIIPKVSLAHEFTLGWDYDPATGNILFTSVPEGLIETLTMEKPDLTTTAPPPPEKDPTP